MKNLKTLQLSLLGRPFIQIDGLPPSPPLSLKAVALLSYLGMTEQMQSRELLAGLLWSDIDEEKARRNLRVELNRMKPLVGDFLQIERRAVGLNQTATIQIDGLRFQELVHQSEGEADQLETAVSLYHGDFLSDFSVPGAFLFDEWAIIQREQVRQLLIDTLHQLATQYTDQNKIKQGITAVRKLLLHEPWLEAAHRQLMRLLAMDGQRAAALAQYDTCTQLLMAELGVTPSPETDAVYDEIESGEISPIQLPKIMQYTSTIEKEISAPFQPPAQPPHFVGRKALIENIEHQLMSANGLSLVALVGMGGIGKSALATQIAHQLREEFTDGVLWANCLSTEPRDVLENWGQAYGYDFSGLSDLNNRAAAVRGVFADKKVLIILDDVNSVSRIRPLLPNGKQCAVILTTRNLDIATAIGAKEIQLDELALGDGLSLLKKLLGEERVENERSQAEQICNSLQNLPLAVEIIGKLLRTRRRRKLADMAFRLQEIENRLGLEINDRAVRTSFEVSWQVLGEAQKQLFRYLAVFEGRPFTGTAVASIIKQNQYETEDILFELVALSLLNEEAENHYRQHTLLADFAHEKLSKAHLTQSAFEAMSLYYQELAIRYEDDFHALRPEWGNVMAGLRIAHSQRSWLVVLSYADSLSESWLQHGRFDEMRHAMKLAEEAATALNNPAALAEVYLKWGEVCLEQNDHEEASLNLNKVLEFSEKIQNDELFIQANYHLGRVAREKNEFEAALDYLTECLQRSKSLKNDKFLALSIYRQARVWSEFGPDLKKSNLQAKKALKIQEHIDDSLGQIMTLRLLAENAFNQKEYALASEYCDEAQKLSLTVDDIGERAAILYLKMVVHRFQQEYALAIENYEKSLELFIKIGSLRWQGMLHYQISIVFEFLQKFDEAFETCFKSIDLFKQTHNQIGESQSWIHLADLYEGIGKIDKAEEALSEAKNIAIALRNHALFDEISKRLNV